MRVLGESEMISFFLGITIGALGLFAVQNLRAEDFDLTRVEAAR